MMQKLLLMKVRSMALVLIVGALLVPLNARTAVASVSECRDVVMESDGETITLEICDPVPSGDDTSDTPYDPEVGIWQQMLKEDPWPDDPPYNEPGDYNPPSGGSAPA